jgi:hypothetical protein
MRIHTDVLTTDDLHGAVGQAGLDGVWVDSITLHRSTKRAQGIEFRLAANPKKGRRRRNTGQYGAEDSGLEMMTAAATYDEHGEWMAVLFDRDPNAVIGPYEGRDRFHDMTKHSYGDGF